MRSLWAKGFLAVIFLFFIPACHTTQSGLTHGTVQYIELEGGFYGIVDEKGNRYQPLNLPRAFKKDGLPVAFRAEPAEGILTLQMWGTPVRITSIHHAPGSASRTV